MLIRRSPTSFGSNGGVQKKMHAGVVSKFSTDSQKGCICRLSGGRATHEYTFSTNQVRCLTSSNGAQRWIKGTTCFLPVGLAVQYTLARKVQTECLCSIETIKIAGSTKEPLAQVDRVYVSHEEVMRLLVECKSTCRDDFSEPFPLMYMAQAPFFDEKRWHLWNMHHAALTAAVLKDPQQWRHNSRYAWMEPDCIERLCLNDEFTIDSSHSDGSIDDPNNIPMDF